jgi:hypothetical protein
MNTSKVAVCVLGCLVTQEVGQRVDAIPTPESPGDSISQLAPSQVTENKSVVSVTPPENLLSQQFAARPQTLSSVTGDIEQSQLRKFPDSLSIASPENIAVPLSSNRLSDKEFEINKALSHSQAVTSSASDSRSAASSANLIKPQVEQDVAGNTATIVSNKPEPISQPVSEVVVNSKSLLSANSLPVQAFGCERLNGTYTTVLAGTKTPLVRWRSREFSRRGYTPERRCKNITYKLNQVVSENDNRLSGLWLTMGKVNRYRVLCSVNNTRSGCNKNNLLMTLSYQNRWNPEEVMARLLNFAVATRGNSVQESAEQTYINLEQWVNQRLEAANNPKLSAADSKYWEGVLSDDLGKP